MGFLVGLYWCCKFEPGACDNYPGTLSCQCRLQPWATALFAYESPIKNCGNYGRKEKQNTVLKYANTSYFSKC